MDLYLLLFILYFFIINHQLVSILKHSECFDIRLYVYFINKNMFPNGVDTLFVGHTHVQFMHEFGRKIFCNPGAVGQPRDGDPRAAYVIYENNNIHLQRLEISM